MNRRDFLKALAVLPGLAFLRPELPEIEDFSPSQQWIEASKLFADGDISINNIYLGGSFTEIGPGDYLAVWDGSAWIGTVISYVISQNHITRQNKQITRVRQARKRLKS